MRGLWWRVLPVALGARGLVLSVVEPAAESCTLEHVGAQAALQLEVGDPAAEVVTEVFATARLCFVVEGATRLERCLDGTSEAWFESLRPGPYVVRVVATAPGGEVLGSSSAVNFNVADAALRCGRRRVDFPLSEVARRSFTQSERRRRNGAELQVHWPLPGDVVRSTTLVLSTGLVPPAPPPGLPATNRSVEFLTGLVCVHALRLQEDDDEGASDTSDDDDDDERSHVDQCLVLEDADFIEFRVPPLWLRDGVSADLAVHLTYSPDDGSVGHGVIRSAPVDVAVRAFVHDPPLLTSGPWMAPEPGFEEEEKEEEEEEGATKDDDYYGGGWVVSRSSLQADPSLLERLGVCLVLCHWDEDLAWLRHQPYPAMVYEKRPTYRGDVRAHSTPRNTANEASAFLQFVVDYYEALPPVMVFLHSHRYAYHQEDILSLLHDVDVHARGYCNLNLAVWGTHEDPERRPLYFDHRAWVEGYLGPLPDLLLDRCCAQFVVHRDRVHRHPRAFYAEALSHALHDVEEAHADPSHKEPNRHLGLMFEWLWHYIFGEPAVAAELADLVPNVRNLDLVFPRKRPLCLKNQSRLDAEKNRLALKRLNKGTSSSSSSPSSESRADGILV